MRNNPVGQLQLGHLRELADFDARSELTQDVIAKGRQVPQVGMLVVGAAHFHKLLHDPPHICIDEVVRCTHLPGRGDEITGW